MQWRSCPICRHDNPPSVMYCASCGADFSDPDVLAMAPSASQSLRGIGEAGELSASRFLGFSHDGLVDGRGVRILCAMFGTLLLAAFVLPVTKVPIDYIEADNQWIFESLMSWEIWNERGVSKLALLLPAILGALCIALAAAPRIPAAARAAGATAAGLVGLFACLGGAGEIVGTPERTLSVVNVAMCITGVAAAGRVLRPKSREARIAVCAGAGLVALGYVIPLGEVGTALPGEFRRWAAALDIDLSGGVMLSALGKGLDRRAPDILFTSFFMLAPLLAAPAAAWFGWKTTSGPWDKGSLAVRPLAWYLVLAIPLAYAMYAFNAVGFTAGEDAVLLGRVRLLALATSFALLAHIGGIALFDAWLRRRSDPAA